MDDIVQMLRRQAEQYSQAGASLIDIEAAKRLIAAAADEVERLRGEDLEKAPSCDVAAGD